MVSRLRRQFVTTAMISLLIIVVLMIAVINFWNFAQLDSSAASLLTILSENGGEFPSESPAESETTPSSDAESEISPSNAEGETSPSDGTGASDGPSGEIPGDRQSGTGPADRQPDGMTEDRQTDAVTEERQTGGTTEDGQADTMTEDRQAQDPPGGSPDDSHRPRSFPESDINETRRIEAPFETRYFTVLLDADGTVSQVNTEHIAAIEEDTAVEYALTVQYNGRMKGYASSYRYLVSEQEDGGMLVIFVDCSSSLASAQQLLLATVFVGAAALALMFLLVLLLSGRAVAPAVESLEKQKRFISDAGHELKTPITVISANVAVLEMTGIQNEWTDSIRGQTKRMTSLVNNLLTLSRMEEDAVPVCRCDVDFSELVRETAASFEAVAQAAGLEYNTAVREGLHVDGDPEALRQLCTVLLDNAAKYASPHGSIYISLKEDPPVSGRRAKTPRLTLEVSNTCDSIPEGNLDRLFDRFYRADSSRTRRRGDRKPRASAAGYRVSGDSGNTDSPSPASRPAAGGFGIGLSVAKAVAVSHGGSITASADGDRLIRFRVSLPLKKS